jgi:hypothetical protein
MYPIYDPGMNERDADNPNHSPNRIECERCGDQGVRTFTAVSPEGALELRRLCEDCHRQRDQILAPQVQDLLYQMMTWNQPHLPEPPGAQESRL